LPTPVAVAVPLESATSDSLAPTPVADTLLPVSAGGPSPSSAPRFGSSASSGTAAPVADPVAAPAPVADPVAAPAPAPAPVAPPVTTPTQPS
jgi:hypothetical protein